MALNTKLLSMKKLLLSLLITAAFTAANAQAKPGPIEQRMTDSLCNCIMKLDMATITTKQEAVTAYTGCVQKNADLLPDLTEEKKIDMTDQVAMRQLGIELAKNLMKQKCSGFMQLSVIMAKKDVENISNAITGTFKRIDNKGFNYIVIADNTGSQKSFLWLREFNGSDKFAGPAAALLNKRIKITWEEMEVYLPAAKGYFKVKEITAIDIL